jgi:MFS transporter, AAHS family, 4-hydroxybenzoate transporter
LPQTVNVSAALDEGRWTGYQKLLIAGTALTIILDGLDNQLLPNAVPKLMAEWQQDRTAFNQALSTGPFGMMIGGALGGYLGDRFGRRTALLGSVVAFAVLTLAVAWADSLATLAILRFVAGIGLGGAMPNAAALAAEYVPRRQRPFAVTLTIVCIPLGGVVAAQLAGAMIELHGWQSLFIACGAVSFLLGALLFFILPESPRYLARHRERWPELANLMRRMGHDVPADAVFVESDSAGASKGGVPLGEIFAPSYLRDTLALCASFFFCLMVNYIGIQLIPVVFTGAGFARPDANRVLAWFNWGGVAGAILGAMVIKQFGSRVAMLGMSAIAVVVGVALSQMTVAPGTPGVLPAPLMLLALMVLGGALLNGVQTTMYALAANVYPTEVRGTGVGTAVAFGRIGNVLAAYVGNYALTVGKNPGYFLSWSIAMGIVLLTLSAIGRHIPRTKDLQMPLEVKA